MPDGSLLEVLVAAVDSLADAMERLRRARAEHEAASEATETILRSIGADRAAGGDGLPIPIAQRLYWEFPDVRVGAIAAALCMQAGEVYKHVGRTASVECSMCRKPLDPVQASRSRGDRTARCDACDRALREGGAIRMREQRREDDERRAQYMARLARGGYWIDDVGEAVLAPRRSGYSSCNRGGPDGCVERLEDPHAWDVGGEVVWRCPRCGKRSEGALVVWVPTTTAEAS